MADPLAEGPAGGPLPTMTGFENHGGVTTLGPEARPLSRTVVGVGNGAGTEGAWSGRVVGTYLHGPVLARNPSLADRLLSWGSPGRSTPSTTRRSGRCGPSGWPPGGGPGGGGRWWSCLDLGSRAVLEQPDTPAVVMGRAARR